MAKKKTTKKKTKKKSAKKPTKKSVKKLKESDSNIRIFKLGSLEHGAPAKADDVEKLHKVIGAFIDDDGHAKYVMPNPDKVKTFAEGDKSLTSVPANEDANFVGTDMVPKPDDIKIYYDGKEIVGSRSTNIILDDTSQVNATPKVDLDKFKEDLKKDLIEELPEIPVIPSTVEDTGFNVSKRNVYSTKGTPKVEGDVHQPNNKDTFKIDKNKSFNNIDKTVFNMNK